MSSSSEKADLLFKASLGFPSTNKEFAFFQESASANNYLLGEEVLVDAIPETPSFSGGASITYTLSDSSTFTATRDTTSVVDQFQDLPLTFVPNSVESSSPTSGAWYCLDSNGKNILQDAIQFNYKKKVDGTQPYLYSLYNGSNKIVPSNGTWIFDVKMGIIKFYGQASGINSSTTTLKLNFFKYVGKKGVKNITLSGGNGSTGSQGL